MKPARLIALSLLAWAGLALLQLAWHGWLHPPVGARTPVIVLLALLPLVLPLLAWRRGARRMLLWAGMAALAYFAHGVMEAWAAPPVRGLALLEAALAVVLIVALGSVALVEKRARRAGSGTSGDAPG